MEKINVKKIVEYWRKTADYDYETMLYLFRGKRYLYSLFLGHIILEKILKALVAQETKKQAEYTHDLARLRKAAKINLSPDQVDLLYEANEFNIRSRYPDIKLKFHERCTKEYTENYLKKIKKLYKELCLMLKQKK